MKNILVTGGAGFIGCNFVRWMLAQYPDYQITVYDKLTYAGRLENLQDVAACYPHRYHFAQGSLEDVQQVEMVVKQYEIDTIVNFAAESHVERSVINPGAFIQTNVYGVNVLLETARKFGGLRYHQISTDEVYGHIDGDYRCLESDPLRPRNPYAATKACAEHLVNIYYTTYGLPITISRGSNNIGPYQHPEKVVPLFITNALHDLLLPVHGDGNQMRDYQHVMDHCAGINMILHKGAIGETYNVGTGRQLTTLQMTEILLDELNKSLNLIQHVKDRQSNDRRYGVDIGKLQALGWKPEYTCEKAIRTTALWYVENRWWWEKIRHGEFKAYYQQIYGDS